MFYLDDGLLFPEDDPSIAIIVHKGCLGELSVLLGRTDPAAAEITAATVFAAGGGGEEEADHQVNAADEEEDEMQQDGGEVGGVDEGSDEN